MSLGKDFAVLRKNLGFSVEEVYNEIKIPKSVIESIEDNSIFDNEDFNKTYTRSFVRSYGKFLGLSEELIVKALDLFEAHLYVPESIINGDLINDFDISEVSDLTSSQGTYETSSTEIKSSEEISENNTTLDKVNWADLGKQFSTPSNNQKLVYPILITLFALGIAILVYVFKQPIINIFSPSAVSVEQELAKQKENDASGNKIPADSNATNDTNSGSHTSMSEYLTMPQENTIQNTSSVFNSLLSDTLTLTVYAAFDKLEPVRITSDLNWRTNPFWMEKGEAFNFIFKDTILVRGQYSRMLLMFNGHVISNSSSDNYNETFRSILLTREILSADTFISPPPINFPFEVGAPDSLVFPLQN